MVKSKNQSLPQEKANEKNTGSERSKPKNSLGATTTDAPSNYLSKILSILIVLLSIAVMFSSSLMDLISTSQDNSSSSQPIENGGWLKDEDFMIDSRTNNVVCDFPVLSAKSFDKKRQFFLDGIYDYPFVVRGMMSSWPAMEKWSKPNMTKLYGSRKIKTGSESSIVYGGGLAGLYGSLNEVLDQMSNDSVRFAHLNTTSMSGRNQHSQPNSDSFVFDVSILESIPELENDIRVPSIFSEWDNPASRKEGVSWHLLSLGASRTGVYFRNIIDIMYLLRGQNKMACFGESTLL